MLNERMKIYNSMLFSIARELNLGQSNIYSINSEYEQVFIYDNNNEDILIQLDVFVLNNCIKLICYMFNDIAFARSFYTDIVAFDNIYKKTKRCLELTLNIQVKNKYADILEALEY